MNTTCNTNRINMLFIDFALNYIWTAHPDGYHNYNHPTPASLNRITRLTFRPERITTHIIWISNNGQPLTGTIAITRANA